MVDRRVPPTELARATARLLEENAYVLPRPRAAIGLAPGRLDRASNAVSGPEANAAAPFGLPLDNRAPHGSR